MYVHAAQSIGASTGRILWKHILPNIMPPIIVLFTTRVGAVILVEAGLSFLGLGVRPPIADWVLMLSTLRQSIYVVPLVCALPGVAIFITSICFNLVSDGLRAAMDVRM